MVSWVDERGSSSIRLARQLGFKLTKHQRVAFRYLEMEGQRFCCEFGVENAVDKMCDHLFDLSRKGRIH